MEPREQRGLIIAARHRIKPKGNRWLVPSQTDSGKKYTVCPDDSHCSCTCPDFEERGEPCKHIFAARYTIEREYSDDGSLIETETITVKAVKKTYPQNWPAYNAAQTNEKAKFQTLLHDLCAGIEEPIQVGRGHAGFAFAMRCSLLYSKSIAQSAAAALCPIFALCKRMATSVTLPATIRSSTCSNQKAQRLFSWR